MSRNRGWFGVLTAPALAAVAATSAHAAPGGPSTNGQPDAFELLEGAQSQIQIRGCDGALPVLRNLVVREDFDNVNHKRVRRLYRLEGLQLRMRVRRRKHIALHRGPAPTPTGPTERWSMDFVYDALADGRPFRVLTVVDQWSRQSPILEVGTAMSGRTVGEALDPALGPGVSPRSITVDHGTEFTSRALEDWAYHRRVQLDFIRPGKPVENAFMESCTGHLQDECVTVHQFASLDEALRLAQEGLPLEAAGH